MSRALSKSLGTDLASLAQVLRSKGRGRDTVLAHITPKEAALLKRRGGRGSINPDTGLPEFEDDSPIIDSSADTGGASEFGGAPAAPVNTAPAPVTTDYVDPSAGFASSRDTATPATPATSVSSPGEGMPPDVNKTAQAAADATPGTKDKTTMSQIGDYLSNPANLAKLGLLGGLGIFGANQGTKAAAQTQAATGQIAAMAPVVQDRSAAAQQQLQQIAQDAQTQGATSAANLSALGAPAKELGTGMMSGAVSGNLTPANQAAMAALKAQAEQGISQRGGVGAMQAGVAEESAQAQLAQQQLQSGLASPQRKQLVTWMKGNTTGDTRIRAGVPKGWIVADKTGAGDDYGISNDIGIIWPPSCAPIVIAIYSVHNNKNTTRRDDIIASATRLVINEFAQTDGCVKRKYD